MRCDDGGEPEEGEAGGGIRRVEDLADHAAIGARDDHHEGEDDQQVGGRFDAFKRQLTEAALTIMGSGWAALEWDPIGKRLVVTQIHDHQSEITQASLPLLVLDAWEHAYYLQYRNEKAKFFEAVWKLWSWKDVAARFASAQKVDLNLEEVLQP